MAKLRTMLAAVFVPLMVVSDLCGISIRTVHAQEFTVQPVATIDLAGGASDFGTLSCSFTTANNNDVIGWVVDTGTTSTRIFDGTLKNTAAITASLGAEAVNKMTAVLSPSTGDSMKYAMDFFSATDVIAGDYRCVLCTFDGNTERPGCGVVLIESTAATVRVQYQPSQPPVCNPPSTETTRVTLGESVTLSCSSEPGEPMVQLQWLRDSQVIGSQVDPVLMDGLLYNNYTFIPNIADESAEYVCRMTSNTGNMQCTATTLQLVSAPQVTVLRPDGAIPPGDSATFRCTATSQTNQQFTYGWELQDIPPERYTVSSSGSSITIDSVTIDDHSKSVTCTVTDGDQMTGSNSNLIVVDGQVIPSGLPTMPPDTNPPSTPPKTDPPMTTQEPGGTGLPLAVIIVLVLIVIILLCIIAGTACFCYKKSKREKAAHIPHTVVKNNLSSNSPSPYNTEKSFAFPNGDSRNVEPDVIPRERPVDAKTWWRESSAPEEANPTLKSVNMPFRDMHSPSSKSNLADPYQNQYNPAYDDMVDPKDLNLKPVGDERDYSDSGIEYREPTYPGDNGYQDEKYGKSYDDRVYSSDAGYDDRKFDDRGYGDGNHDPYEADYRDPYSNHPDDYERVYDDDYRSQPDPYSSNYDAYPDRMPDGSEGYDPPTEGYNDPAQDGYGDPSGYDDRPSDYNQPSDYAQPANYEYSDQPPMDYGYDDGRSADYGDRPAEYDDYNTSDYPAGPVDYHDDPVSYDGQYTDQYDDPYYPADRMPDGGPPVDDQYDDGYGNYNENYDDGADYAAPPAQDLYTPSFIEPQSPAGHSHNDPYYDPDEEVSGTSNPSYV